MITHGRETYQPIVDQKKTWTQFWTPLQRYDSQRLEQRPAPWDWSSGCSTDLDPKLGAGLCSVIDIQYIICTVLILAYDHMYIHMLH